MTATIYPIGSLTPDQVSLICRRWGLRLKHLGWGRFTLERM